MLPREELIELLTHATVFACPSIYEPLGIVNLEAMACETAVVASDVGGIPEVVVDGETGTLVHYAEADPATFEAVRWPSAVNALAGDPARARGVRPGRVGAAPSTSSAGRRSRPTRSAVYESAIDSRLAR